MRKPGIILALLIVLALVGIVSAQGPITFPYYGDLVVTYVSSDAGYNNEFGMYQPVSQSFGFIHNEPVGKQYTVGHCTPTTDVVLYITSPTGHTYYSDLIQSGDLFNHANVVPNGDASLYTVYFENLYGTETPDWDFNDVVLSVSCTKGPNPPPVPEFPTMALPVAFIIGMLGAVLFVQKYKEN
jgi:hypothetical protein